MRPAASRALPNGTMESAPLSDLGPFLPREAHAGNNVASAARFVAADVEPVPSLPVQLVPLSR